MSRSSRDTGHSCDSRSRVGRISTGSCPLGCPCRLASSPKSWRRPLSPWENKVCAFSTASTTGSYSHSLRRQLSAHRDLVLKHLSLLGLRVNWEKSKLVPTQRISFLCMEFDSVNQTARLTQERAQSVLNCFKTLSGRTAVPLKHFQRLLGHMAAAAVTVPLGLLHMRPLQHWLYGRIPRLAWKCGTYRVQITPACRKTFRPWSDPSFLRAGVPLEQVSRHAVVFTDASTTGWGATYNGHAVSGVWTGPVVRALR